MHYSYSENADGEMVPPDGHPPMVRVGGEEGVEYVNARTMKPPGALKDDDKGPDGVYLDDVHVPQTNVGNRIKDLVPEIQSLYERAQEVHPD